MTVQTGGLGAHNHWERNGKRADREGITDRCRHCNQGMSPGNGWLAAWQPQDDTFVPLGTLGAELVRLGPECARRFQRSLLPADRARFFQRMQS